ncbi:MAG: hypothetical protein AAF203_10245, partial [Pseudomonadota bacterium]
VDRSLKKGSVLVNTDCWSRKVGMRILPPISVEGRRIEDVKEFRDEVRDKMFVEHEQMKEIYH